MPKDIVYFDLETQRTANDVGGWDKKHEMGMSLAVLYSSATGEYEIYSEKRVDDLIKRLLVADLVVGYNVLRFDYEVLMGYTIRDLRELPTLDMLIPVERKLGHRLSLDAIATGTFGYGKTADGIDAIRWWREGELLKIAEYCCFDVKVTRLVHTYAEEKGELFYFDRFSRKQRMEINWELLS